MNGTQLDALRLVAGDVSRETFVDLLGFEAMFRQWAGRINLVSSSTLSEVWDRHVLDSAQLAPMFEPGSRIVDLGSGGGFPGMVLAILLRRRVSQVALVESNSKKAAFLKQAAARFAPDVAAVHNQRVEVVVAREAAPDYVTARAFAPLQTIIELTAPWTEAGTTLVLHKGRDFRKEIADADDVKAFDLVERPSVAASDGVILALRRAR